MTSLSDVVSAVLFLASESCHMTGAILDGEALKKRRPSVRPPELSSIV